MPARRRSLLDDLRATVLSVTATERDRALHPPRVQVAWGRNFRDAHALLSQNI